MNKKSVYVAFVAIAVAFLIFEPPPALKSDVLAEQTTQLVGNPQELFQQLIRLDILTILFADAINVLPMDASPWQRGKMFRSNVTYPFIGMFQNIIRLVKYDENRMMEFETDSFFIARHFLEVTKSKYWTSAKPRTSLRVVVSTSRSSIFFHTFVGPVLRIIYRNKLYHRLFTIRQLIDTPPHKRRQVMDH